MWKLIKQLKPYTLFILLAVVLLFAQAMADLALPDYMSKIVNVGLQQGGVTDSATEAVRKSQMDRLLLFVDENTKTKILSEYYTLVPAGTDAKLAKKYPTAETEDIYTRNDTIDAETLTELDNIFAKAWLTVNEFESSMEDSSKWQTNESGEQTMPAALQTFIMSYMTKGQGQDILEYMMTYPEREQVRLAIDSMVSDQLDSLKGMLNQAGAAAAKEEYLALGMTERSLQNGYIWSIGALMLLLSLASAACTVLVALIAARIAASLGKNLRRQVFEKVSGFASAEFDKFSTASLITRTTNDITQIQMLMVIMIRMVFYAPILGIGGVFRAIDKSLSMSWIIALAVVVIIGMILTVFSVALPKFKLMQKLVDRLNLVTRESLSGMMVIRAFNTQSFEEQRFDKANQDLTKTGLFVNRVMVVMMPVMMLVMNGVSLLIIWVGAHQIAEATLQIGDMMAFMQYAIQILMSFLMLSMMFIMIPRASVSAVRVSEILETEVAIKDPAEPQHLPQGYAPVVAFEDVTFYYPGAEQPALKNISFTALPGQTTAFIGSTGSGKSTLVNLVPRFYDVSSGRIAIGGIDVRELPQKELREQIGYVPQKASLFSGTIESNIRYGVPDASEEELLLAAETAQAGEIIKEKTDGLASEIAQGGDNVSGGQKQRLSIARALAKKAPVYIFDDSFSALDFKTDAALRRALKQTTSNSTILLVAQRISTIMQAQQIIVLNDGEIVGKGTHAELLESCPTYQEIAYSQLSKEELK